MKKVQRVKTETGVTFIVGETKLAIDVSDVPQALVQKLLVHGLNAKCGDAAASAETDAERIQRISTAIANLKAGVWSAGGGGNSSIIVEAISRVMQLTIEEAQEKFDALDDEAEKLVRKHPKVKEAVAKIQQERTEASAKASDTSQLDKLLAL